MPFVAAATCSWDCGGRFCPRFGDARPFNPATIGANVQILESQYINTVVVGQPISLLKLKDQFVAGLPSSIPEESIQTLTFAVYINGVLTAPTGNLIYGDPESYFFTTQNDITVVPV